MSRDRRGRSPDRRRSHSELRQVVGHYLARLDPDGTEPDPTEQRSLSTRSRTEGRWSSTVHPRRDRRGEAPGRGRVDPPGLPPRRGPAHALPAAGRRARPAVRQRAGGGEPADPARAQAARRRPHRPRGPDGHHDRSRRRQHRLRRWSSPRRRPAGWPATATSPASSSAPKVSPWTWGRPPGCSRRTCAGPGGAGPALRLRRLRRPQSLVRRPPRHPLDRRRRHRPGQRRPALRTPPHQGPPRLPHRTTTRRPMAHLAPDGTEIVIHERFLVSA